jgi:hypothetical protein
MSSKVARESPLAAVFQSFAKGTFPPHSKLGGGPGCLNLQFVQRVRWRELDCF